MGFIKAFAGALGGTFADQWKDFIVPMSGVPSTAAIIPAVAKGTNNGRGSNTKGSDNIITNGSKIVVPEGYGLVTMQDGAVTGCITEAGGFIFSSEDPNAQSIFSGDGVMSSIIKQTWERVKFGGQPSTYQTAFFVNLRKMPCNFGTQNPIRWLDNFFQTQVACSIHGMYEVLIADPITFIKAIPTSMLIAGEVLDLADPDNDFSNQLFNDFVECIQSGISKYMKMPEHGIEDLQSNPEEIYATIADVMEEKKQWKSAKGLVVGGISFGSPDYDEKTLELLEKVREEDLKVRTAKRMGEAYGNNMMAAAAGEAMKDAANNPNGSMAGFMGMNMMGNMMGGFTNMQQQQQPQQQQEDPYEKLEKLKKLLDSGVISQEEFDEAKKKVLGV